MKIYKIKCERCGHKYRVHRRQHYNPSITLEACLSGLVIDGVLLFNYMEDGNLRKYCTQLVGDRECQGKLTGYYIKVRNRRKKDGAPNQDTKPEVQ